MSLIIPRNFKRAKAQDAAAQDAQFKIGDVVTLSKSHPRNPGKSGKIVQVFPTGFIKVKFADGSTDIEMERNISADSRAADSIADKEREYARLYELAQKNITFYAAKGDSAKVAEWKHKADEYKRLAQEAENAAEVRNGKDSRAQDAAPKKGDKVFWRNGPFKFEGIFLEERGGRALVKTDRGDILVNGKVYVEGETPTYHDTPFGRIYD